VERVLRLLAAGLIAAAIPVLAIVVYALAGRFVLHGPVTGRSLAVNLAQTAGSAAIDEPHACTRAAAPGTWRCFVVDPGGSGGASYRVAVEPGSSCWSATVTQRAGGDEPLPTHLHACVHRWQWTT
jgi:hypothetical protein